jgi:hypothetical protein
MAIAPVGQGAPGTSHLPDEARRTNARADMKALAT